MIPRRTQKSVESYFLTPDLEVCDDHSAHYPVRPDCEEEDDMDSFPHCFVGGGELNMAAGIELVKNHKPSTVVCAYGARSGYLADPSVDGPSESEVMTHLLLRQMHEEAGEIITWPRDKPSPSGKPAHTGTEIGNILELALEDNCHTVAIVTVGVHVPRAALYLANYMSRDKQLAEKLMVTMFHSEEVLLAADYHRWAPRVAALRNSQAFKRNWAREADGMQKIVRDVYADVKPPVETAASATAPASITQ